ncbi:hypothetical protein [uncultured Rubinisphaera sp.]|uniref:hypothetical protein n=1 Tax=uncultured Rubinisphaera sp. TaxID=1678686 RepID=UPI0030DAE958
MKTKPAHKEWAIGEDCAKELPVQIDAAIHSAEAYGIPLPAEFVILIRTPELHKHIRSVTACYLNIARSLLPFDGGYLLRFLHDQQDCAFWYLYLNAEGSDHCVVTSYEFFDADNMDHEISDLNENQFQIQETSFERFMAKFWIENEILFAEYDETEPPEIGEKFLKLYSQ